MADRWEILLNEVASLKRRVNRLETLEQAGGAGTGLDADLLDGQHGAYYLDASNLNAGTIALARIPATLTGKDADTLDGRHATGLRVVTAFGSDDSDYTILGGAGLYESDTTLLVTITPLATSTVYVLATGIFTSDTARNRSAHFGVTLTGTLRPPDIEYVSMPTANDRMPFTVIAQYTSVGAGGHDIYLSCGRYNGGDAVVVENRQILAIAVPD